MLVTFVDKLKTLPSSILILHFFAKLVLGIGIGVILVKYLNGFGWWLIFLALLMSIPGVAGTLRCKK